VVHEEVGEWERPLPPNADQLHMRVQHHQNRCRIGAARPSAKVAPDRARVSYLFGGDVRSRLTDGNTVLEHKRRMNKLIVRDCRAYDQRAVKHVNRPQIFYVTQRDDIRMKPLSLLQLDQQICAAGDQCSIGAPIQKINGFSQ
jgi:hypothetical protein